MPAHLHSTLLRRFVTTTLAAAALGVATGALAQTSPSDREAALEARVAELEKLVKQLMAEKQTPAPAAAAAPAAGAAPAAPAAP